MKIRNLSGFVLLSQKHFANGVSGCSRALSFTFTNAQAADKKSGYQGEKEK